MQCPDCGYMLTAFDQVCPRCETLGKPRRSPFSQTPATPATDMPAARSAAGRGTGVIVLVTVFLFALLGIAGFFLFMRPATPGPRMKSGVQRKSGVRVNGSRRPGSRKSSTDSAIIAAAKDATFRRYGIPGSEASRKTWEKQLKLCSVSIKHQGGNRAKVRFTMKSGALLDQEVVKRSRSGRWHPATAFSSP